GQFSVAIRGIEALRARHLAVVDELLGHGADAGEVAADVSVLFDELAHLGEALSVLGDVSPRSLDAVAAYGERLSSPIVAAAFQQRGIPATWVDARKVMVTDGAFGKARPQGEAIAEAARAHLLPLVRGGRVPVLGGYIGATPDGITTTLGRGGSDYSAALFGAALDVQAIEIWTDVDGMLTADPRVAPGARLIEHIRFDEAAELASFGAKVLHPSTIAPAVQRNIPVFIFNSHRPQAAGTRITFDAPRHAVRAVAGRANVVLVNVKSSAMLGTPGIVRGIFSVFERYKLSVDVIATSEVSVSVTLDADLHLDAVLNELRTFGDVSVERGRGIVAVVGSGLGAHTPTMARALGALGEMRVHMCSLSASAINLTLIVDGDQVHEAMRRLHRAFFEEGA
ncbi:MAG: aspartate kinase, partial [Gemmatimonadaceae bacterium]|nr:aspartate kinase [Gemmatimonadaceae bacterium]